MNNSTEEREPFLFVPPVIKIPSLSSDLFLLLASLFFKVNVAIVETVTAIIMMIEMETRALIFVSFLNFILNIQLQDMWDSDLRS